MSGGRFPRDHATSVAEGVVARLEPHVVRVVVAGSIRRGCDQVGDIELVAEVRPQAPDLLGHSPGPDLESVHRIARAMGHVLKCGPRMVQVAQVLGSGITLDLFLVHPPAEWGIILAIRTGPADVVRDAVTRMRARGLRCSDGRIEEWAGGRTWYPASDQTERAFYRAARMPLPPWLE